MTTIEAESAARARVDDLLERMSRVDLQVVVVAPPDAQRVAARDRARAAAKVAGRTILFDEAVTAARETTLRAFARGGFSGTWAANDWSISIATASDRVAAAAAFEEAAMAAVVEDLRTMRRSRCSAPRRPSSSSRPGYRRLERCRP